MNKFQLKLAGLLAIVLAFYGSSAVAAATAEECRETLKKFRAMGNVSEMLAESYGYAIFPTIGKGGLGIGGAAPLGSGRMDANKHRSR